MVCRREDAVSSTVLAFLEESSNGKIREVTSLYQCETCKHQCVTQEQLNSWSVLMGPSVKQFIFSSTLLCWIGDWMERGSHCGQGWSQEKKYGISHKLWRKGQQLICQVEGEASEEEAQAMLVEEDEVEEEEETR